MKFRVSTAFLLSFLFVTALAWNSTAQMSDQTLFTVNDRPVSVGEFEYIYKKNNQKNASYNRDSLRNYLDLYIKFKLKVEEARNQKLDTIQQLKKELGVYRQELAKSYLTDKEVMNRLEKELYERKKNDIDVSHILISAGPKATPKDTLRAFMQAKSIRQMLDHGQDFSTLAHKFSADKNSAKNGGHIGYVTAKLPDGFYRLETAIYNTKPGNISGPIRSRVGYHIIKVHQIRPARGMVKAAHILIRKARKGQPDPAAKTKIEKVYDELQNGASFEALVKKYSEDKSSKRKGGDIGWFGINKFEDAFEDAAFSLKKDGDYSKPVETSIGWHIIKRLKKKKLGELDKIERSRLEREIREDSRFKIAQDALIEKIKKESGFKVNQAGLDKLQASLDKTLFSYKWKAPKAQSNETLISLGGKNYNANDILNHFKRNTSVRLSMDENTPLKEGFDKLIDAFIKEKAIKYEEAHLEEKYPDFKALMREYEEGILLFEAAQRNVWNKAAQDTAGLRKFYNAHKMHYMHPQKVVITTVNLSDISERYAEKLYKKAKKKGLDKALSKYRKKYANVRKDEKQIAENEAREAFPWIIHGKSSVSPLKYDSALRTASFQIVTDVIPAKPKTLEEAKGYILSDYQNELDKQWVEKLRKKYKVQINEKAFDNLVKKGN